MGETVRAEPTRRALVVDDDKSVRTVTSRMLACLGYEVSVATDGAHALDVLDAGPGQPHVILLDYHMPRMNGHVCFNGLRDRGVNCPVLLCSGYCSDVPDELLSAVDAVIEKPFRLEVLRDALARVVGPASFAP